MLKKMRKFMNEEGNSFLMFIFLMPVLCGAFGLGLDTAFGQYTRQGIQDSADLATTAGANQTSYAGNKRVINEALATKKIREVYLAKREAYPNITKSSPTIKIDIITGRSGAADLLDVTVREKSSTIFLHLVGVSEFTYNINSQARLGYVTD